MVKLPIPLSKIAIGKEELKCVEDVLASGWLVQGPKVASFEERFARFCSLDHAAAVSSGAAALHLALKAYDIGVGDEVIVPSLTFVATVNPIVLEGAKPVFAEVDADTFNILPESIESKITPRTKAIIPVHYGGQLARMDEIADIAQKHNLTIIEDAAHAHGAESNGRKAGALGDAVCFSFHPMKNMTTGEGGMVLSNDERTIDRIKILRAHGEATPAWQRFNNAVIKKREFVDFGYNYRMSDIGAAIGIAQLKKLNRNNNRRLQNAKRYQKRLSRVPGITAPTTAPRSKHVFHLYTIKIDERGYGLARDGLQKKLNEDGISTGVYYNPVHLEPAYRRKFGFKEGMLPVTETLCSKVLSLPMYPTITRSELERVTESIMRHSKEQASVFS